MRRRRGPSTGADRGEASLEHVVVVPVVMLVLLMAVQFAIYFHAANVASLAAERAAASASRRGAMPGDGAAEARAVVAESGSTLLALAVADQDPVRVSVTVAATRLVPFMPSSVTRHASEARERFVDESQR
jgi:Flp pilus assembly protein TadG